MGRLPLLVHPSKPTNSTEAQKDETMSLRDRKPRPVTGTPKTSSHCSACDGDGERCNNCGETEAACWCDDGFSANQCEDCGGTGR